MDTEDRSLLASAFVVAGSVALGLIALALTLGVAVRLFVWIAGV